MTANLEPSLDFYENSCQKSTGDLNIILFNSYCIKKQFNFADLNDKKVLVLRILLPHAVFSLSKVDRKVVLPE